MSLLSEDQVRCILMAENMYSLRPVEFAAQHGSSRMVTAIMDIPGVYLSREERHGLTTYQWYDVTDYEASGERFAKSPLLLLAFVDTKVSDTRSFNCLLLESWIEKWYDAKFKTNIPFIVLLFVVRVLYIGCYILMDMDTSFYGEYVHGNTTQFCRPDFAPVLSGVTKNILRVVLLACAVFTTVVDVTEIGLNCMKRYWHLNNTVESKKKWLVQVVFYKCCNLIFSLFVVIYVILGIFADEQYATFYDIFRVTCPILAVWNILYFFQLLPSIGSFIIAIQTILQDLLNFSIVYIIFMIPFIHSFQTVINTNTNTGCIKNFDNPFRIAYSLFITMLNMMDYTTYDIRNLEVLLLAHVAYTFVVSIMMINFFIALLSNSVNKIGGCKSTVMCIQRCSVAMVMERRCRWLFKSVYSKLKQKYFQYENGRYFIVRVKSVLQDDCKRANLNSWRWCNWWRWCNLHVLLIVSGDQFC